MQGGFEISSDLIVNGAAQYLYALMKASGERGRVAVEG